MVIVNAPTYAALEAVHNVSFCENVLQNTSFETQNGEMFNSPELIYSSLILPKYQKNI